MKIRIGFVSNSSSSSFLCLGVEDSITIEKLLEAEKFEKDADGCIEGEGYGMLEGKVITFYGTSNNWQAAGIEAKKLLEKMTLPEARKECVKIIKDKLGVEINAKSVDLLYGEASSE